MNMAPRKRERQDEIETDEDERLDALVNAVEATTDVAATTGFGAYNDPTTSFGPDDDTAPNPKESRAKDDAR
jgi:hypothetical protein